MDIHKYIAMEAGEKDKNGFMCEALMNCRLCVQTYSYAMQLWICVGYCLSFDKRESYYCFGFSTAISLSISVV
jgi:hypothetical protein